MSIQRVIALGGIGLLLIPALCFAQAANDRQSQIEEHSRKAQEYLREKQPGLAIPELQALVAIDAENVEAQGNLGVLLFFQGNAGDAIPHLRVALEHQPGLAKIQGLLGMAERRTLDLSDARKDMEAAFPSIQELHFQVQLGLELVSLDTESGDLEGAAAVIAQLRKADPENAEVLYAAYRTYSDLAGESMLSLSLAAPDSAQMHQLLAHEEIKEGNTNGAIAQYRKAIAINPNLPGIHFELAELLNTSLDANAKKDAEQEYHSALKANPLDEKAECRLGDIDAARGNTQQAFEEYSKATELQPADADAKLDLAKILIEMNQSDKALALLEQAVQLEPTNPTAHYRLATLYRKNGRIDDAKHEVDLYKQYKDLKEKLRTTYKDLLIQPKEIRPNEQDEQNDK
jgi:tetratricopeptide (TPR) repeat protein